MTTVFVILYCVVAFLVDHATMRAWKDAKRLGAVPQEILENEKLFRFGVLLGSFFWPINAAFAITKAWRK